MRIALVARGDTSDQAAIDWLVRDVTPVDDVHLLYPYRELAVHGSAWPPAVHAADAHRDEVRRKAQTAVLHARAQLDRIQPTLGSSIISESRADVLSDIGAVADMVVIGMPEQMPAAHAIGEARRIRAHRVAVVPEGCAADGSTIVLADPAGALEADALRIATQFAEHANSTVLVMRRYRGISVDRDDLEKQTELLDEEVAAWHAREHPQPHPAFVAELVEEPLHCALRRLGDDIGLVVAPKELSAELGDLLAVALGERDIPVLLIDR